MKILAVDYGDARTGLAACDKDEMIASPVGVIKEYNREKLLDAVAACAAEQRVQRIVVGNPLNMNGTAGERSGLAAEFAGRLEERSGIPVVLWDERSTTVSAIGILNADRRARKKTQWPSWMR